MASPPKAWRPAPRLRRLQRRLSLCLPLCLPLLARLPTRYVREEQRGRKPPRHCHEAHEERSIWGLIATSSPLCLCHKPCHAFTALFTQTSSTRMPANTTGPESVMCHPPSPYAIQPVVLLGPPRALRAHPPGARLWVKREACGETVKTLYTPQSRLEEINAEYTVTLFGDSRLVRSCARRCDYFTRYEKLAME